MEEKIKEMHFPNEKDEILGKIIKIAKQRKQFTRSDCRDAYLGEHMIEDWQFCLNHLVKKKKLKKGRINLSGRRIYSILKQSAEKK